MELLERGPLLDSLERLLAEAMAGRGRLVFLGGEAGAGKTTLVRELATRAAARPPVRVLRGACDPLSTPTPLGPLLDIAATAGGRLDSLLNADAPRERIFAAALAELRQAFRPALVILEDLHWADDATLDLLRYLGRRVADCSGLIVATYRDDEVDSWHPLRRVLGDLASMPEVVRLSVPSLSPGAVAVLARGSTLDPAALYQVTGGNPFYVTEALAAGGGVPPTVRDAVLARAARLSEAGRGILELAAVIGATVDERLLASVAGESLGAVEESLAIGMLLPQPEGYGFRHELARQAILDTIPRQQRVALHGAVLTALRADPRAQGGQDGLARLAHHAEAALDTAAVLAFAPRAAERAIEFRAHREAAAQYARALRFADDLPPEELVSLLEARAYECYLTDQTQVAIELRHAALEIWTQLGNDAKRGENLRWLSRLSWFLGREKDARRYGQEAVAVLEQLDPGPQLAMAYSNLAQKYMLSFETDTAISLGQRAIALAEQFGDTETVAHALNNVGSARLHHGDDRGLADLERSLAISLEHAFEEHAARAWTNLASNTVFQFRLDLAERYLTDGLHYSTERDLDSWRMYMSGWFAILRFLQGRWPEALDIADIVLRHGGVAPVSRIQALLVRGRVAARRGEDAGATEALDAALELAIPSGEFQRIGPVRIARAEAAWLAGDRDLARAEAQQGYDVGLSVAEPFVMGELLFWLARSGGQVAPRDTLYQPFRLQMNGAWSAAASFWTAHGCTYEAAAALAETDDPASLRTALATFERLGAAPMIATVSRRLRDLGASNIPRGPRPSTRANPAGLTSREMDVLRLLAEGQRNAAIAERLFLSPKTVDHHVSAILAKLGVSSRTEAVAEAARRGLLPLSPSTPPSLTPAPE